MTSSTLTAPSTAGSLDVALAHRQLVEQRSFRVDQLRQLSSPGSDAPLSSADPEILRELVRGARAALREVQAALWRIDEQTYGLCTRCGGAVERHRLEILPATATCLPCRRAAP